MNIFLPLLDEVIMPKLQRLINQKPRNFLALAKAVNSGEDLNMQDEQGYSLFEILLHETFANTKAQSKKLHEAWLNRFLSEYRSHLKLDDLLKKILNEKGINKGVNKEVNLEQMLFLIRAGASPNITNEYNVPLLLFFTHYDNNFRAADVEELVLRHGVAVDQGLAVENDPSLDDKTCLRLFLDSEENPNQPPNWTAIMTLIAVGANVNTQNANGDTALHLLVKKMLEPQNRLTKLFKSPPNYQAFIIKLSRSGADLTILNNQGDSIFSPFFNNCDAHLDSLMNLVRLGIHPDQIRDSQGKPLLHYLCDLENGLINFTSIGELVNYHANLEIKDAKGQTLKQMLINKNKDAWDKIVTIKKNRTCKPIPYSAIDCVNGLITQHQPTRQDTPLLHYAVSTIPQRNYPKEFFQDVFKELKRRVSINSTNKKGETAFVMLLNQKPLQLDVIRALLDLGADVNSRNKQGNTLLHLLVTQKIADRKNSPDGSPETKAIDELIDDLGMRYKADFSVTNNRRKTPTQMIMDNPDSKTKDMVKLVNLGANPNVRQTSNPYTPFITCIQGEETLKKMVLTYNADPNLADARGQTIMDRAVNESSRNIETIYKYLRLSAQFSEASFKKLTHPVTGFSKKDLIEMAGKQYTDSELSYFFYKLLIGRQYQPNSEPFYDLIKNFEEPILVHIDSLSIGKKVNALLDILAEGSALAKLMLKPRVSFLARFSMMPSTNTQQNVYPKKLLGMLGAVSFYQQDKLSHPELLVRILSHASLANDVKNRAMQGFNPEGMKVFRDYLISSDHTDKELIQVLHNIKADWHIYLGEEINDEYVHAFLQYRQAIKTMSLTTPNFDVEATAPAI